MSTQIAPWLLDELRLYADGEPLRLPRKPSANLVKRNLLVSARETAGSGHYRLTDYGRRLLVANPIPEGRPPMTPDMVGGLATLRFAHPSFGPVADMIVELADDPTVTPEVYEKVCRSTFVLLSAWADERERR